MTDARLVGTNPDTSELVPVAVNAQGQIKTEAAKIEEIPNDLLVSGDLTVTGTINGESGGGGISLPPNPQEGQVLGWENGQLAWMSPSSSGFFFYLDLLVVAGGGESSVNVDGNVAPGGAGGMFHTWAGEFTPQGVPTPGALKTDLGIDGTSFTIKAGSLGENSKLVGGGLNIDMQAGGQGGNRGHGGSGGGGFAMEANGTLPKLGGQAFEGQGSDGGDGGIFTNQACADPANWCFAACFGTWTSGAGGGAGGAPGSKGDRQGLQSSITGTPIKYAWGGGGADLCPDHTGGPPSEGDIYGTGASQNYSGREGVVYLRYPNWLDLTVTSGSIETTHTPFRNEVLTRFLNGEANILISIKPEVVMSTVFDYLRRR